MACITTISCRATHTAKLPRAARRVLIGKTSRGCSRRSCLPTTTTMSAKTSSMLRGAPGPIALASELIVMLSLRTQYRRRPTRCRMLRRCSRSRVWSSGSRCKRDSGKLSFVQLGLAPSVTQECQTATAAPSLHLNLSVSRPHRPPQLLLTIALATKPRWLKHRGRIQPHRPHLCGRRTLPS